jgi:hypothetical protein
LFGAGTPPIAGFEAPRIVLSDAEAASVYPQKGVDPSGKTLAEWHHRKVWFSPRGVFRGGFLSVG